MLCEFYPPKLKIKLKNQIFNLILRRNHPSNTIAHVYFKVRHIRILYVCFCLA